MNSTLRRLCTGLILLGAVGTASAQAVAPPNVHFLFDTSGSMRDLPQVEGSRHSEFFDITTGGCFNPRLDAVQLNRGWNPDTVYAVPDTGTMLGSDTGFPNLFQDSKFYGYMYWADLSNPTPQWNTKEDACQSQVADWTGTGAANYSRCLSCLSLKGYYKVPSAIGRDSAPLTNPDFIFWGRFLNFNPPKYVAARAAIKQVIKDIAAKRMGLSRFNTSSPYTTLERGQNPSCSQIRNDASSLDNHRAAYINTINGLQFFTNTPLARSLLNIGYYFTSGDDVYRYSFGFGTGYSYPASFRNALLTSESRSVCWGCQHNAVIIISDGDPTGDSLSATVVNQLRAINGGPVYCPDSEPCGLGGVAGRDMGTDPNSYADDDPNYLLDDVAKLLANQDLQMATPPVVGAFDTSGQQSLAIHTVAFGFNSNLLKNTAAVGGGLYYRADNAAALKQAVETILDNVETRAAACVLQP
jgi:type IV pilus assembly protein PilY1